MDHRQDANRFALLVVPPSELVTQGVDLAAQLRQIGLAQPHPQAEGADRGICTRFQDLVAHGFHHGRGVVGAVCHGPVSLLNVKLSDGSYLVSGKNITSFTNDEESNYAKADVPFELETALVNQGAIFHKVDPWQANSLTDGNLSALAVDRARH